MRDCIKNSEDSRVLLKGFRSRQNNFALKALSNSAATTTAFPTSKSMSSVHKAHTGCLKETLIDSLPAAIQGDFGPDHAALCDEHLKQLAKANVFCTYAPLGRACYYEL